MEQFDSNAFTEPPQVGEEGKTLSAADLNNMMQNLAQLYLSNKANIGQPTGVPAAASMPAANQEPECQKSTGQSAKQVDIDSQGDQSPI